MQRGQCLPAECSGSNSSSATSSVTLDRCLSLSLFHPVPNRASDHSNDFKERDRQRDLLGLLYEETGAVPGKPSLQSLQRPEHGKYLYTHVSLRLCTWHCPRPWGRAVTETQSLLSRNSHTSSRQTADKCSGWHVSRR